MPSPDRISPETKNARVATSVTLACAIACVVLAAEASIGRWPSSAATHRDAAARQPALMQAVGPAPAFCKNQTWPDIDMRCLNRVEPKVVEAPASAPPTSAAPASPATAEPPAAAPPTAEQNQAEQVPAEAPADVANADATVGMPPSDVWPEQPTRQPRSLSSHRASGWNLPTNRSGW